VEELLFERGVVVTSEAIRKWCGKCGQPYANQLRRRRPRPGDKWPMEEVFLTITGLRCFSYKIIPGMDLQKKHRHSLTGERHYLWRVVLRSVPSK